MQKINKILVLTSRYITLNISYFRMAPFACDVNANASNYSWFILQAHCGHVQAEREILLLSLIIK